MKPNRFRFRAWDKKYESMDDEMWLSSDGGLYWDEVIAYDTPNKEIESVDQDRFIIMFSTGLLDSEGVEIFEGDIVEYDQCTGVRILRVEFHSAQFCTLGYGESGAFWDNGFSPSRSLKVIGNIYENPELLKEKR